MSALSRRQVQVKNPPSLHLRAARRLVELSQRFDANIRVSCNGVVVDARSILDLMTLAANCGARLEVEATGPGPEAAAAALRSSRRGSTAMRMAGTSFPVHHSLDGSARHRHRRVRRARLTFSPDERHRHRSHSARRVAGGGFERPQDPSRGAMNHDRANSEGTALVHA